MFLRRPSWRFLSSPFRRNTSFVVYVQQTALILDSNSIKFSNSFNGSKMSSKKGPEQAAVGKKSFDKSQWRKNKYNHKNKLKQFEEKRRTSALRKYYKELKKSQPGSSETATKTESTEVEPEANQRKLNPHDKAKQELERRLKEKELLRAKRESQKVEREEALQKYKKDKIRKFIKLKQKTKKGQPVMAGRMELLLEKIQKGVGT